MLDINKHKNYKQIYISTCLFFALVVTVLYFKGLNGPFLVDDHSSVTTIQVDYLNLDSVWDAIRSDASSPLGRPLSIASFVLNKFFTESESAFSFKVTNLALHIICALLVFSLLRMLFTYLAPEQSNSQNPSYTFLAMLCTAVWALHPLQVSTVLYVVQRMTILSTLFSLLAIITYVKIRTREQSTDRLMCCVVLICLLTVCAILSKENGVLVFPLIVLIEICVFKFRRMNDTVDHNLKRFWSAVVVASMIAAVVICSVVWDSVMAGYVVREYGLSERLMSQPGALLLYLKMILLPNLAEMSLYHDSFPVPDRLTMQVMMQSMCVLGIVISALCCMNKHPVYSLGIGLFFISHLLESTILPLEPVFEHRNYLAMLGILIPIIWYGFHFLRHFLAPKLMTTCALITLTLLSSQTYIRVFEWSDISIIVNQAIKEKPDSLRARNAYITLHASSGNIDHVVSTLQTFQNDFPARSHFLIQELMFAGTRGTINTSLLKKTFDSLSSNLIRDTEVATLRDLLRYQNKGWVRWPDEHDITQLYKSAVNNPNKNLKAPTESYLNSKYAALLTQQGEYPEALNVVELAIRLNPSSAFALLTRVEILARMGNISESRRQLIASLKNKDSIKFQRNIKTIKNLLLDSSSAGEVP